MRTNYKALSAAEIGARIRAVRGNRTQVEFARGIGVRKQNYISRKKRNRIPSPELSVVIARTGRVNPRIA